MHACRVVGRLVGWCVWACVYITLSERLCLQGSDTRLSQRLFPKEEFWLKPSTLSHAGAVDFFDHGLRGMELVHNRGGRLPGVPCLRCLPHQARNGVGKGGQGGEERPYGTVDRDDIPGRVGGQPPLVAEFGARKKPELGI